ncbi:hypothetical protein J699_01434 [Acinetobacter sp. 1000160]|nr:hypothetical protein J537_0066 [Acinetobacter baumannii 1437282]EXB49390.1 hypothetical protein J522_0969 [Acinetobacter baumannii 146457]EYT21764.1 hypothetical protein J699_01434 [Acinetobacter sp. 1000160]
MDKLIFKFIESYKENRKKTALRVFCPKTGQNKFNIESLLI